jgi:transposase
MVAKPKEESVRKSTTIAVDLAKNVFQVAVSRHPGKVAETHRLSRAKLLPFFAQHKPATVLLEACGSAHHWGREIRQLGHEVLLLPPGEVRRYVRGNKTDRADAKGLLEAHRNEEIRPVPVKSVTQQTLTGLHRLRSAWVGNRTARINTVRGILRELGLNIPVGAHHVVPQAWALIEDANSTVADPLRLALAEACLEIREFEKRIKAVERQLRILAADMPVVQRLMTIPGVGLLTATALVAFVGEVLRFPTGRHFASFLGLTPKERSSGQRRRLGSISKHGDVYLRTLLIHGARTVLVAAKRLKKPDRLRKWALHVHKHRGANKATVALANKMARIVWAVWRDATEYRPQPAT